jgi:hypothetical protein
MAGRQPVSWPGPPPHQDYELMAEPLDFWQRKILWFPFFKDTKPLFKLKVTCKGANIPSQNVNWFIKFSNNDKTGALITIPKMKQGECTEITIGGRLLGYGGDAVLGVNIPPQQFSYETLISFWILRGETILYALFLSLFSAIMGGLITLLITSFINAAPQPLLP